MSLSNSHLTSIIQNTQQRLAVSLRNEGEYLERQGQKQLFEQSKQINYLLTNPQTGGPITSLEELNWNWRFVKYRASDALDLVSNLPSHPEERTRLFSIIKIQLEAIARGQKASQENFNQPTHLPTPSRFVQNSLPEKRVERIYYYGGYRPYTSTDFLTDMLIWDMFTHHHYGGYGGGCCDTSTPPAPYIGSGSGGGSSSDDKSGEAMILIAGIVVVLFEIALTVVATMYLIGALIETVDEMIHLENLAENILKLTGTGAGLWAGMLAGVAIGAALSFSGGGMVFLGLMTGIIGAGLALFAANQLFTGFHLLTNRSSAIDSDPRFKLSSFEKYRLKRDGYDIMSVQEAIREVGLLMKQNKSWHLTFWREENDERKKLVRLLRDLKLGHKSQYIQINGKAFNLWKTTPEHYQAQQPIYTPTPPDYGYLQRTHVIDEKPPAYVQPEPSAPPAYAFT